MSNEEEKNNAPSAEQLYQQSMSLIDEAIKSCGIEGFEGATLAIPQVIQGNDINTHPIPQVSDQTFFNQANRLFGAQENLFNEPEELNKEMTSDNNEYSQDGSESNDPGLNSINDMFNSI
ncbi:hypothetical protein [uncultured Shewanella sp.]|uniref:hypothetical protein n=1 Tax=uncultured Shewanella sp. TaxID=173975 RepID=UPI00261C350F|nr:hypothetical protein [uncultured Shewanella sp.]